MTDLDPTRHWRVYTHALCGKDSTLPEPVFQTLLADPAQVFQLECEHCGAKFPVGDFAWKDAFVAKAFAR